MTDPVADEPRLYILGERLEFSSVETDAYIGEGFSWREEWGRWTDGRRATITLPHGQLTGLLLVEFWIARAFAFDCKDCDFLVTPAGGRRQLLTVDTGESRPAFLVRAEDAPQPGVLTIDIRILRPKAPEEPPPDERRLGLGFQALRVSLVDDDG
jgi:hypothetical protein